MSQTQSHISDISRICQEICDIKRTQKPKSIVKTNTDTFMDEGQTNPNYTQEQDNNSSAKEDSNDGGDLGNTYSSHSTQYHHAPNSHDTPSCHAPSLPSLSPGPPATLSPSPAFKIATLNPSSPS